MKNTSKKKTDLLRYIIVLLTKYTMREDQALDSEAGTSKLPNPGRQMSVAKYTCSDYIN